MCSWLTRWSCSSSKGDEDLCLSHLVATLLTRWSFTIDRCILDTSSVAHSALDCASAISGRPLIGSVFWDGLGLYCWARNLSGEQ